MFSVAFNWVSCLSHSIYRILYSGAYLGPGFVSQDARTVRNAAVCQWSYQSLIFQETFGKSQRWSPEHAWATLSAISARIYSSSVTLFKCRHRLSGLNLHMHWRNKMSSNQSHRPHTRDIVTSDPCSARLLPEALVRIYSTPQNVMHPGKVATLAPGLLDVRVPFLNH